MSDRAVLERLVRLGVVFRNTSIVDADFAIHRDAFDLTLEESENRMKASRPKIICLCGSTRFMEAFQQANLRETLAGNIVLTVGCDTKRCIWPKDIKEKLDELHMRKIDLADEVFVLNVGGYVGESTRNEIAYAKATGKPVNYLEPL